MSDAYLFLEDTAEERAASRSRLERPLKITAVVLVLALAAELLWFLVVVPCRPLSRVEVNYCKLIETESVLGIAGIGTRSSFLSVNAAAAERALEDLPQVESATVTKRFPDRLSIVVVERTAVAFALAEVAGRTVPVAFDKEGVVFSVGDGASAAALAAGGPVVSGLVFELPTVGTRLPSSLAGLLSDLDKLKREAPALLETLSEIRVQKSAFGGYELIVYPARAGMRVRIGAELNEEVLRYMMLLLDVLASKGIAADEIDFRTGTASYHAKEASSG